MNVSMLKSASISQGSTRLLRSSQQSRRTIRCIPRAGTHNDPVKQNIARLSKDNVPSSAKNEQDSFQKIEAPVRNASRPEDRGPAIQDRKDYVDDLLVNNAAPAEKSFLGTEVAFPDAMRFKGAAPEVINCRLAMLGFALAVFFETTTGQNVFQQVADHPKATVLTFLTFIVASLVPILRGYPRYGNAIFKPDVDIIVGRTAMIGFAGLVLQEVARGVAVF